MQKAAASLYVHQEQCDEHRFSNRHGKRAVRSSAYGWNNRPEVTIIRRRGRKTVRVRLSHLRF
jgi:hypothetical protein